MTIKNKLFIFKIFLINIFISLSFFSFGQYTEADIYTYIDKYKEIALKKMHEYKIPASITLAQGIFESACGTSKLATMGKNHFGIKCHTNWTGDTIRIDDDELQECFRKYEQVEDSYNDHCLFLTSRPRYKDLFTLDIMDYKAWAVGLKAAGYATNPEYANKLIGLIERFNIHRLDSLYLRNSNPIQTISKEDSVQIAHKTTTRPNAKTQEEASKPILKSQQEPDIPTTAPIFTATPDNFPLGECPWTELPVYENNKTQFIIAREGDTYKTLAKAVQRSEKELRKFNDSAPGDEPKQNQVVYIEPKSKKYQEVHIVNKGETLRYIAQKYAVQLHCIFMYNNLNENSIIQPGDSIKLSY